MTYFFAVICGVAALAFGSACNWAVEDARLPEPGRSVFALATFIMAGALGYCSWCLAIGAVRWVQ